jgi:hypothetical protein
MITLSGTMRTISTTERPMISRRKLSAASADARLVPGRRPCPVGRVHPRHKSERRPARQRNAQLSGRARPARPGWGTNLPARGSKNSSTSLRSAALFSATDGFRAASDLRTARSDSPFSPVLTKDNPAAPFLRLARTKSKSS